ncbi:MAG: DUF86 domain-containing protein [Cyclobacteriaceae bacterium]
MVSQEDQVHLNNIVNSISEIDSYIMYLDYNQFLKEEQIQGNVARNLQMIGSAAGLLSDEVKDQYGYVDFDALLTLKNAAYNVEYEQGTGLIWQIATEDLPRLKEDILTATEEINRNEDLSEQ